MKKKISRRYKEEQIKNQISWLEQYKNIGGRFDCDTEEKIDTAIAEIKSGRDHGVMKKKVYIVRPEGICVECLKWPCDFLKNYIDPRKEIVKWCKHKKEIRENKIAFKLAKKYKAKRMSNGIKQTDTDNYYLENVSSNSKLFKDIENWEHKKTSPVRCYHIYKFLDKSCVLYHEDRGWVSFQFEDVISTAPEIDIVFKNKKKKINAHIGF